jgi:hypothetical protein
MLVAFDVWPVTTVLCTMSKMSFYELKDFDLINNVCEAYSVNLNNVCKPNTVHFIFHGLCIALTKKSYLSCNFSHLSSILQTFLHLMKFHSVKNGGFFCSDLSCGVCH